MSAAAAAPRSRLDGLEDDIRELRSTQGEIFTTLKEVREAQIRAEEREKHLACADPGACIRLNTEVETMRKKHEAHEAVIQQVKGMGMLARWLWIILGASGVGAAVKYIISK